MPRYLYGMRHLRGFGPGCQPARGLISREDDPAGKYNDVLVYDRELEPHELDDYELDFMGVEPDTTTDGSNVVKKGGNDEDRTSDDCISRTQAIDALDKRFDKIPMGQTTEILMLRKDLRELPSIQPTLYGYNIGHLELIARVLQKENLPPERVAEALIDIGRIVAIVRDEFEETLRKAVEECTKNM